MEQSTYERRIREAAMAYLSRSPDAGSLVDYRWAAAFHFEGERVALLDAQRGIRKIHDAAYDADILGVSPDLVITVRTDVLAEVDGPMLRHGIQAMHARRLLVVPTTRAARPDRDRLAERYEEFLRT